MKIEYKPYTKFIALFLTVVLVYLLLTQISLNDIITTIISINPLFLITGFFIYSISYLFRAWRFHILLNKEVPLKDLFYIECVHNMMNNLLPLRTGELSYVYLVKKVSHRTIGEGLATLILARFFDFFALAILFLISVFTAKDVPMIIRDLLPIISVFILILILIFIFTLFLGRFFIDQINSFMKKLHIEKKWFSIFCLEKGYEITNCLERIDYINIIAPMLLFSLLIWGCNYTMGYLILIEMGISLSLPVVLLGLTFTLLSTTLPINGIAGFGTNEGFWTLAFVSLGLSLQMAIISGFSYHIILIIYYLILGMIGYLTLNSKNRPQFIDDNKSPPLHYLRR